jgi:Mn-dependent DtxR family transcriptional regulator
MIQAQLSEALGCEPPSVTLMTRKLEASGHIRRSPAQSDKRVSVVELTDSGRAIVGEIKELWRALAEETVTGVPAETAAKLPGILATLADNVDTRHPRNKHGRSQKAGHTPTLSELGLAHSGGRRTQPSQQRGLPLGQQPSVETTGSPGDLR